VAVLIIAHRGASADAPENTLAAFEEARRQQADMIEIDVQPTADGTLLVFHDDTTERWNGRRDAVSRLNAAQIADLRIGGEPAATLRETLAWARDVGMPLNIELKTTGTAAATARLIAEFGLRDQVIISSFLPAALHETAAADRGIALGYLMYPVRNRPVSWFRSLWPGPALRAVGARAWHPYYDLPWLPAIIPSVRAAGYQVNVWTVDDPAELRRLAAIGVDGLITNRPAAARAALRAAA
jgi:glycerophosphoryl diester phosphodiesterase